MLLTNQHAMNAGQSGMLTFDHKHITLIMNASNNNKCSSDIIITLSKIEGKDIKMSHFHKFQSKIAFDPVAKI